MNDTIILVVDDNVSNLALAQKILGKDYKIAAANSGIAALKYLENHEPDLILLDISMPDMDGFETMEHIKEKQENRGIPIIFLTADKSAETETLCFRKGAVDFVSKPFIPEVLFSRVKKTLELETYSKNLEKLVEKKTKQAEHITLQSITAIANTIDAKDEYTKGHSVRVAEYSELIAEALGWGSEEIQNLKYTALLHDIGKIGVPDYVLNKPGRLTDVEFELIKAHAVIGGEILKDIKTIDHLVDGAVFHHERYDGTGYPHGVSSEDIPVFARIIGVADAYDAMSSDRVYRQKLTEQEIFEQLQAGRGIQFDPVVLDAFVNLLENDKINPQQGKNNVETSLAEESTMLLQKVLNQESSQREEDMERDYLTGLFTRKSGEKRIIAEMREHDGVLCLIDMDNLKYINDTYGHLQGDYAIKTIGLSLSEWGEMTAIRYGGDEFVCFLKDADQERAEQQIELLKETFKKKTEEDEILAKASLSIGACVSQKGENYTTVFQNADRALYYVKETGKGNYYFHRDKYQKVVNESVVDMKQLVGALQNNSENREIFHVEFREFSQIYDYLNHLSKRYEYPIQLVMITVQHQSLETDIEQQHLLMGYMYKAIASSLRGVDIVARFSSAQYLVVLVDAQPESVAVILKRIFQKFYQSYQGEDVDLSYDTAELEKAHE